MDNKFNQIGTVYEDIIFKFGESTFSYILKKVYYPNLQSMSVAIMDKTDLSTTNKHNVEIRLFVSSGANNLSGLQSNETILIKVGPEIKNEEVELDYTLEPKFKERSGYYSLTIPSLKIYPHGNETGFLFEKRTVDSFYQLTIVIGIRKNRESIFSSRQAAMAKFINIPYFVKGSF
jgi:hypothetical protein